MLFTSEQISVQSYLSETPFFFFFSFFKDSREIFFIEDSVLEKLLFKGYIGLLIVNFTVILTTSLQSRISIEAKMQGRHFL